MSLFTSDIPANEIVSLDQQPTLEDTASTLVPSTEDKKILSDDGSKGKRCIENIPFQHQFSEVEKAITNFTKHQPFNHHYAPNVNINNNSNNSNRSHHHHNNNHHHYNNNNNSRGINHHGNHHHHNNNGHYNNNINNGNNNARLQPQTFTMNAQLKQQQQQQFLSSAAQQINNRINNGSLNPMVSNVNNMSMTGNMGQISQMNQLSMNSMPAMNQMVNGSVMPSHAQQQGQGYLPSQYHRLQSSLVSQQQQHQQQQQTMPLGNYISGSELKYDSYGQPQLSHNDFITPLRNTSPQFSAPARPVSVSGFGSPLEQINSNSSFGIGSVELQSRMSNSSSGVDAEYGEKKMSLGDSTYLGDIWGCGKSLRDSASVWA